MVNKVSQEIEDQVLAYNGKLKQDEVAKLLGIALPTIRSICRRNNVKWIWQLRDQYGENNPSYINGMGRSTIERATRNIVIKSGRDLFTCEVCKTVSKDREQDRHHKDRDRSNNSSNNIAVLCQTCHMEEHNRDRDRDENGKFLN